MLPPVWSLFSLPVLGASICPMSVPWIPFRASAQVDTWEFPNYLLF